MSNERKTILGQLATAVSTLSGLCSIAIVVFMGGGLVKTVEGHESRLNLIETAGSRTAAEHITLDNERDQRMQLRVGTMETELKALPRIEAKLDALKERLDERLKQLKPERTQ